VEASGDERGRLCRLAGGRALNLFVLHRDPAIAARWQCDRHVVKMTLEAAQILCSAAHLLGQRAPYRPTHLAHPCVIWAAASRGNWRWVVAHGLALAREYERRYGRPHRSLAVFRWAQGRGVGPPASSGRRRRFATAMPERYRAGDPVAAYRRFYAAEKARFATWRAPAKPPPWWPRRRRRGRDRPPAPAAGRA
jgi:hypothetical protein